MLEIAARANPGDIVLDFPARPYTIGTTHETPTPTKDNRLQRPGSEGI
jgi:hypothetical protein